MAWISGGAVGLLAGIASSTWVPARVVENDDLAHGPIPALARALASPSTRPARPPVTPSPAFASAFELGSASVAAVLVPAHGGGLPVAPRVPLVSSIPLAPLAPLAPMASRPEGTRP